MIIHFTGEGEIKEKISFFTMDVKTHRNVGRMERGSLGVSNVNIAPPPLGR